MKKTNAVIFLFSVLSITPCLAEITASRVIEDGGSGTHSALMMTDASLPTHTLFRPEDISDIDEQDKLPVIVWGNGACHDSPWEHVNFLNEIASHGFLVIAIGTMPKERPKENGEQVTERSTSSKLTEAIDWAITQNSNENSAYFQKIATDRIGVSGMSCGGLQALEVAGDPRISTLVIANSGIFNEPMPERLPGMPQLGKQQLEKIHTPTLYLLGGPSDIAYDNGMNDVERIKQVPVFVGNLDVGHGGTYSQPNGGEFARVAGAWFKWQLKNDEEAAKLFVGNPPGFSEDPEWTFDKKNMPSQAKTE